MTCVEPLPGEAVPGRPARVGILGTFWDRLEEHGAATALRDGDRLVSYTELAALADASAARLGTSRRLVLLPARNDLATVVALLGCLRAGHPVVLADARNSAGCEGLAAAYDPDVHISGSVDPEELVGVVERRPGSAHHLHPELALLLSTSGSTGSPRLVRLSAENLASNASAIAESLGIRPTDRAVTTLPLQYCYGLSVLTSHLAVGASVALTSLSVVDPGFWTLVRSADVSSLAGVPHTFELLDRVGFPSMQLPALRYLTQAGGRMDPATVRRYAETGRERGFDLFVMYGATEATARMAVLPPDLALTRPEAVGRAVPGGSFAVAPLDGPPGSPAAAGGDVGELLYAGPNVMLGYAESPDDLARGREVDVLRTGDLARLGPDGLVEVVGRRTRFAKVFGLRVDLDRVERAAREVGVAAWAADGGDRVVVVIETGSAPARAATGPRVLAALRRLGVPPAAVLLREGPVPRLASGKPDYPAIARSTQARESDACPRRSTKPVCTPGDEVAEVFRAVLGRPEVGPEDTFVSLGGDSLSYVEASLRLESVLGRLPEDWHTLPVGALAGADPGPADGAAEGRRRRLCSVETNVLLRALAIVMVVGSHANLFTLLGGAHVLFGVAGYNFARFQLVDVPRHERVVRLLRSTLRIAVPSVLWLAFAAATSEKYGPLNVALLNGVLGSRAWTESWHYWFVEALVWTLVGFTALFAVPAVDRLERRHAFWLPYGLALAALLTRYDAVRLFGGDSIHRAHVLLWLFALGWAAARAPTWRHRALVSVTVLATVPGFFEGGQHAREAVVVVGLLLATWVRQVRVPRSAASAAAVLASASLYIYLCHWQIYPAYEFELPWLATSLSLAAGVVFWWVATRVATSVERVLSCRTTHDGRSDG